MSDSEPIAFRRHLDTSGGRRNTTPAGSAGTLASGRDAPAFVVFTRLELSDIFNVYGRRVAAGDWRDYAIDWGRDIAVFSIFRRASEVPIYRVEKNPKLARRQGAYSVVTATGLVLKRGQELRRVLDVIDVKVALVK